MDTRPARLSELISSAWMLFRERQHVIFPGVAVFTVFMAALQAIMIMAERDTVPALVMGIVAGIVSALLGLVANLYFLLAVIRKDGSMQSLVSQTFPRILPFIWLSLLVLFKTFAWVALLGLLIMSGAAIASVSTGEQMGNSVLVGGLLFLVGVSTAIVWGPRYMLSHILWLVEGKGVRESVDRSYAVTTGYWGKISGNVVLVAFVAAIVMGIAGAVARMAVSMAAQFIGGVGTMIIVGALSGFVSYLYQAYMSAFLLKLTATIIANPRGPVAPMAAVPVKAAVQAPSAKVQQKAPKTPAPKTAPKKKKA